MALAGTCQNIRQIRCMEIINYDTYDSAAVMFDVMGFGGSLDETPMLLQPGVLSLAWGSVVRQLAAGLGIELDEVNETHVRVPAPRHSTSRPGVSRKAPPQQFDSRCAESRTETSPSSSNTSPGCVTTCAGLAATGSARRLLPDRDHRRTVPCAGPLSEQPQRRPQPRGLVATAARVVNAIPAVIEASPGIVTARKLPHYGQRSVR